MMAGLRVQPGRSLGLLRCERLEDQAYFNEFLLHPIDIHAPLQGFLQYLGPVHR